MVWGWVHNFPTLKDVFTRPVDYPTDGFDIQIADWYQDVFDAAEAVQEYLLAGVFVDRGDPDVVDFGIGNLLLNNNWQDLDLSDIVDDPATGVSIRFRGISTLTNTKIFFRTKGNTFERNISEVINPVAVIPTPRDLTLPLRGDKTIQYKAAAAGWTVIEITVKGWWKS